MTAHPSAGEVHRAELRLRAELGQYGLLLAHDVVLPSATRCIAGESIRGSWWGHPMGSLIYRTMQRVEPDIARVKLVAQKSTLVHRDLWPALAAVARSGQDWQRAGLVPAARELLREIELTDGVRADALTSEQAGRNAALVKALEARLLIFSKQEHTPSGQHVRMLIPFARWQRELGIADGTLPELARALESLTAPVRLWVGERIDGLLPWLPAPNRRHSRQRRKR